MGFWGTVGKGLTAVAKHVGEAVEKEKRRQDEIYDRYSRYDDDKLRRICTSKDDGLFDPGIREKRIAAKILKERRDY